MPTARKRHILGFIFLMSCPLLKAQSILIDSLKGVLARKETTVENRIMATAQLARITSNKDVKAAIVLDQKALVMTSNVKDPKYRSFIYSCLVQLYELNDSTQLARNAVDSAMWYADKSGDKTTKGFAWYRKGWLQGMEEQPDSSMKNLLQALRYLDGQKAYNYECSVNYFIASIYGDWNDPENELKYARLCLQKGLQAQTPDEICIGYQSLGSYFIIQYRKQSKGILLDSALYYNRQALATGQQQHARFMVSSTLALVALNTANIYAEFYSDKKDSAIQYLNTALSLAKETTQQAIVASCYGMLSDYSVADGDYNHAEFLLHMGLAAIESFPSASITKARIMEALAKVAEKKGDKALALDYYKQYIDFYKTAFDAQQQATAKKLEAQYQSEKKEKELALLQQRAVFNKKLNFIYFSLAAAALLALIFFFRAYHFRLRASLQKSLLNETKAQLQLQLQAEATARLEAEQQLLQERQERLQNELLAGALQVEEKNELLQALQKKITTHNSADPVLRQMDRIITDSRKMNEDFESAKSDLADIHPEFITRLQEKAAESLTRLDLKYCAYIRMGLSNKEIAGRLAVEAKSIRMARYRLKQKLNLQKEESLDNFLSTIV
jgi:DNA-binding CsgD family transcriptional regulator